MATKIKIGHASISENNSVNGDAGDQTGREVFIKDNYDIGSLQPNVVLRPKTALLAEMSARACEAGCANNKIGYSQYGVDNRNTLYSKAAAVNFDLTKITTNCNTDCSAFMSVCAIAGGANIKYGDNGPVTSDMRIKFERSGDYDVLTDAKHTTITDYLKRGDILVREGKHTVMVLSNGINYTDTTNKSSTITINTSSRNVTVRLLDISVINIKDTEASVLFRVLDKDVNTEGLVNDIVWLKNYTWQYEILNLTNSQKDPIIKSLDVTSATTSFQVAGLTPDTSYSLLITAIKQQGSDQLSSRNYIFTTKNDNVSSNISINLTDSSLLNKDYNFVNKIYLKVKDTFKRVLLCNIKEGDL